MIYVDTSVVLAYLLRETRVPAASLWEAPLVSSRLLEYETWNRLHAHGLTESHGEAARTLLERVSVFELTPDVLAGALAPFPLSIGTLDGLHLATIIYVRERHQRVSLATYDKRMNVVAGAMGIPLTVV